MKDLSWLSKIAELTHVHTQGQPPVGGATARITWVGGVDLRGDCNNAISRALGQIQSGDLRQCLLDIGPGGCLPGHTQPLGGNHPVA